NSKNQQLFMEEQQSTLLHMSVDAEGEVQMQETSKWGKLFAILSISAISLFILLFIIFWSAFREIFFMEMGVYQNGLESAALTGAIIGMVIMFSILLVLMLFLLKGCNRMRLGLQQKDQILFNNGLANIKNFFVMYGVIAILNAVVTVLGLLG